MLCGLIHFIHSRCFSSSPLLLRGTPDYSIDTCIHMWYAIQYILTLHAICWTCSTGSPQQRILFQIIALVWRSLQYLILAYFRLWDDYVTTLSVSGCRTLCFTEQDVLILHACMLIWTVCTHTLMCVYATTTLVHVFLTVQLDYCSLFYAGLPPLWLWCLDHVLRSAACFPGRTPKFEHISSYMLCMLHWLPLQQRILFQIIASIWRSLLRPTPAYLWVLYCTTLSILGRHTLCSAEQGVLIVHFERTATKHNCTFSLVGPLALALRLFPRVLSDFFFAHLKTPF